MKEIWTPVIDLRVDIDAEVEAALRPLVAELSDAVVDGRRTRSWSRAGAAATALLAHLPAPSRSGWGEWTPGVSRESAVATAIDEADAVNGLAGLALDRADLDALVAEVASDPEWYGSLATIASGGEPCSDAWSRANRALDFLVERLAGRGELPAAARTARARRAVGVTLAREQGSAATPSGATGWMAG